MPSPDRDPLTLYDFFLHAKHKPINKWQHYFDVYERHFQRFRGRNVNLLEIGILHGGSLQMWKAYFGNESRIFGVDVDSACKQHEQPGVTIFIGDAGDKAFLADVLSRTGPLDIVIDDGGHWTSQQINAFEMLYPAVVDEGVYLVEDTHTNFWPGYMTAPDGKTFLQLAHEKTLDLQGWTSQLKHHKRMSVEPAKREGDLEVSEFCRTTVSIHFYDSIVVFEKGRRSEPWNLTMDTGA